MNHGNYSGMMNGLSKVNLSAFGRAQAELHLSRAAAIVDMLMGSNKECEVEPMRVEAPIAQPEFRKAA